MPQRIRGCVPHGHGLIPQWDLDGDAAPLVVEWAESEDARLEVLGTLGDSGDVWNEDRGLTSHHADEIVGTVGRRRPGGVGEIEHQRHVPHAGSGEGVGQRCSGGIDDSFKGDANAVHIERRSNRSHFGRNGVRRRRWADGLASLVESRGEQAKNSTGDADGSDDGPAVRGA